jgi:hypothetical protein
MYDRGALETMQRSPSQVYNKYIHIEDPRSKLPRTYLMICVSHGDMPDEKAVYQSWSDYQHFALISGASPIARATPPPPCLVFGVFSRANGQDR